MEVVNETWYKKIEDPDTLYTDVTALKLLDHITKFCLGLHIVNSVDIPQLMKLLFTEADIIPQFINAMEAAQRKSKWEKLVIQGECIHAVALKLLLKLGEYETETRERSNFLMTNKHGRRGKQRSGRRMWQRDGLKQPGKERKNLSVIPQYTTHMSSCIKEVIQLLICQPHCQIRFWTQSRATSTTLPQPRHKLSQKETHRGIISKSRDLNRHSGTRTEGN